MTKLLAGLALLLVSACATAAPVGRDGAACRPEMGPASASAACHGGDAINRQLGESGRLGMAIDSLAETALRRGELVGLSIAVLHRGEPVRVRGYGIADLEHLAPATDSTRYYIGSITKTVTAAAVLGLAEQGRLSLDDDVAHHVPELDSPGLPISLRHLLTHTSGLAGPQQVSARFLDRRHLEFSRDQLLELLRGEPRVSAPGERFAYNNLGYNLLGITVERVSGRSFEDHLRQEVLAPAAASMLLCDPRRVIAHRASGYEIRDGSPVNHEPVNASLVFAAGGLCSNAADVARWLRALARGYVVMPATFRQMATPGTLTTGSAPSYGYGLFVDTLVGHSRVYHGGVVNGFSSHAAYYPDEDLAVVVLTNTRGLAARRLEEEIARRVLGLPPLPRVPADERVP